MKSAALNVSMLPTPYVFATAVRRRSNALTPWAILTTNFDEAVREVRYLIEHPTETVDRTHEQQSKTEWEKRSNELRYYALSLKQEDGTGGQAKTQ